MFARLSGLGPQVHSAHCAHWHPSLTGLPKFGLEPVLGITQWRGAARTEDSTTIIPEKNIGKHWQIS